MNDFLSWCMHFLVPFLFHDVASLHPPSFHRNDFSICSTRFLFWGKAHQKCDVLCGVLSPRAPGPRNGSDYNDAHVPAHGQRPLDTCMQMASFCACSRGGPRSAVEMYGWSKTIT